MALDAFRTVGTEPGKVAGASNSPNVLSRTAGTQPAETSLVIGTLGLPLLGVCVETLVTSRTIAIFGVPPAFRHTSQVVFMQEFARVTLFAETAKPVFADGGKTFAFAHLVSVLRGEEVERRRSCVAKRAVERAEGAA